MLKLFVVYLYEVIVVIGVKLCKFGKLSLNKNELNKDECLFFSVII